MQETRYENMEYRRCGRSGLKLPLISLGLWHNFGDSNTMERMEDLCRTAFDGGITHFDLANNYGPPAGAAERHFGQILRTVFAGHRDELIISTKAGFDMWDGPYGDWGSRKYLLASLDQSLKRLGVDYVDIFYHHRPDPETPLEETMGALAQAVQSGKALYVGLSNYDGETMRRAAKILRELRCPFIINQNCYSMLDRTIEKNGLLDACSDLQKGLVIYSPLAQGLLTDRYLHGSIPEDSRIRTDGRFLREEQLNGKLPVVNFAAGGVATPADAALMMQLGAEGVFVGSGIFKSGDPAKRAAAIVKAVTNFQDAKMLAELSTDLGEAMVGINEQEISLLMAERGK